MDRKIVIEVNGNYVRKDNKVAGVQGEGNATALNFIFDDSWSGLAKTLTMFNARGENPVEIILGADKLTDITQSLSDYTVFIPPEPLEFAGYMEFVVDGYIDSVRYRTAGDKLQVKYAPIADNPSEPTDPTPSQAEQLQVQIDAMLGDMQSERLQAEEAKNTAVNAAEEATASATKAQESEESAVESASEATNAAKIAVEAQENTEANANRVEEAAKIAVEAQENTEANANRVEEAANTAVRASESASSSANSASASASSASTAGTQAQEYAVNAQKSASDASTSAGNASASASSAEKSAANAQQSETNASASESNAKASEEAAEDSKIAAKQSELASIKAAEAAEISSKHYPLIDATTKTWLIWENGKYVDTGISATILIDVNTGQEVKMWFGTVDEYNNLPVIESDVYYNLLEGEVKINAD